MAGNTTLEHLRELAERTDKRLDALEENMTQRLELSILQSGWTNDSGDAKFPYQYVLTVDGVTADTVANAVLDEAGVAAASACGVCAACRTAAGVVVFKSYEVPAADLNGVLYITRKVAVNGA